MKWPGHSTVTSPSVRQAMASLTTPGGSGDERPTAIVSGLPSDSHTWNLLYLQLVIEEAGWSVVNLGCCVPAATLVSEALWHQPHLIAMSTVNGHGYQDAARVIARLRREPALAHTPVVIGGKLGTSGKPDPVATAALRQAGFDAVYDGGEGVTEFLRVLTSDAATTRAAWRHQSLAGAAG